MNWKELLARAASRIDEAQAIQKAADAEGREITEEEQTKIAELLDGAKSDKAKGEQLRELESFSASLDEPLKKLSPRQPIADDNEPQSLPAQPIDHVEKGKNGWRCLGEFASEVMAAGINGAGSADQRLYIGAAASGAQQKVGSSGGFLVPPTFSTQIWDGLYQGADNLLSMTDNYTVEGESLTFPANAETDRSSTLYGGVVAYWIDEADQITSSQPTFRQMKLEPKELAALVYATNKLLNNSTTALEQYITRACTAALNFKIGDAIINGEGGGKPLGVMKSGSLISVDAEAGQAATTILSENIINMWARLHPNCRSRAVWLINVDCETQLQQMTIGVGTGGLTTYLPPGGLSTAPYATLMGRPVLPIEYCQTLGTTGDIILADLGSYAVGQKGGIDSAMSIHLRFDYAESCFRFMTQIDGQSWVNSAITPANGSNTLSPFVALATRS